MVKMTQNTLTEMSFWASVFFPRARSALYYIPCPDIPRLSFCHAQPDDPVLTTKQEKRNFVIMDKIRVANYNDGKDLSNWSNTERKEGKQGSNKNWWGTERNQDTNKNTSLMKRVTFGFSLEEKRSPYFTTYGNKYVYMKHFKHHLLPYFLPLVTFLQIPVKENVKFNQ